MSANTETEIKETRKIDFFLLKRLAPYLKRHWRLVAVTLGCMLIMDVAGILHPYFVKIGIDVHVANGDMAGLLRTSLILFSVLTAAFIFQVLFAYSVQFLGQKMLFDLRMDLFRHILRLSNDYFDRTPVGKTLTNITNDVDAIREFISEGVVSVMGELLKVVFIIVAMVAINLKLALLAFLIIPVFVIVTILFRRSIRIGFRGVRQSNSQINTILQETLTGIREIIRFDNKRRSKELFDQANREYLVSYLRVVHAFALYFPTIEVVSNIIMLIILYVAHRSLGISIHMGEIFAFVAYINMFFRPLRQMAEQFNTFQSAMSAAERIFKLLDQPVSVQNPTKPEAAPESFGGGVVFRNVNFSYKPDTPVLKDVTFEIRPGEKVALVGYTGSGKTTVVNLLNRLYDIQSGVIEVDGIPIDQWDLGELRSRIATVPQDPFLFTGSIGENISMYDPRITEEEIEAAARRVKADVFIEQLPEGYREQVLEEGKRLSVGQKQLISFARALVRRPNILVLDEATSSIDSETEKLIDAALETLLEGRTSIIVAHRLSTIQKAERILVFNKGRIVEQGTHHDLLKKNGVYSRLYQTQAFSLETK